MITINVNSTSIGLIKQAFYHQVLSGSYFVCRRLGNIDLEFVSKNLKIVVHYQYILLPLANTKTSLGLFSSSGKKLNLSTLVHL